MRTKEDDEMAIRYRQKHDSLIGEIGMMSEHKIERKIREYIDKAKDKMTYIKEIDEIMEFYKGFGHDTICFVHNHVIEKTFEVLEQLRKELEAAPKAEISNFTNPQLVLIMYVTLKAMEIDISNPAESNKTPVVQLLHILTNTKFTNIQNSNFQKLIRHVPNFIGRKPRKLIEELKFIKPHFERTDFQSGIDIIDNMIRQAKSE